MSPGTRSNTAVAPVNAGRIAVTLDKRDRDQLLERAWEIQTLDDRGSLPHCLDGLGEWLDLREIVVAAGHKAALPEVEFDGAGYDARWRAVYVRERFILVDPIVRAIADGQKFVDRTRVINDHNAFVQASRQGSHAYARFLQLAHDYGRERGGFAGGVVQNGRVALFSAVADHRDCTPRAALALFALRPVLCRTLLRLLAPESTADALSGREQSVLELLAAGYGDIQIADVLAISVPTVRFHMRNLFEKLGARNRCHAVAIGFRSGLLQQWSDLRLPVA
ncbi:MAG: LuxR family transcriptional regulator [Rhodanobacteraceae bacterium]|nr:MAG: LuxR family transcriptional regulator [Rhodanobacteraceae bacterium]